MPDINRYRPVDINDVQRGVDDVSIWSHGTFMLAEYLKHKESLKAIIKKPRTAALYQLFKFYIWVMTQDLAFLNIFILSYKNNQVLL